MYLKNLTLKGFKSFAEKTSIDLEPGVTVIVGPNGSGKSNVVDAMAWVLGSQAPNALRSSKMDDVIFAGTSTKLALGRAEVSLTIDNQSGTLPIDFTEVKISRTLFRSGESEYAINGVACRLIDITELLSDGGVGRQQHVIVSQGQIDAVLTSRPEDRRAVIEEAAGTLKCRKRKDRATRRLAASEADLTRVKDIIREVKRQLRPLERQAEAARVHGDLVAELVAQRLYLAGQQITDLRTQMRAIQEQPIREHQESLVAQIAEIDQRVSDFETQLTQRSADDLRQTLWRVESLSERAKGLVALVAERRRGLERERSAFADQGVIANFEAEVTRLRQMLNVAKTEAKTITAELDTCKTNETQLLAERAELNERVKAIQARSGDQAAEVRGEILALRAGIATGTKELERTQRRLDELGERRTHLESRLSQQQTQLETFQESHAGLAQELEAAENAEQRVQSSLDDAVDAHNESKSTHQRWLARSEALTLALNEARSRAGAQRVAHVQGVLGTLLDLVAVDEGFESSFESALGAALNAVIVEDFTVARAAFEALRVSGSAGTVLALRSLPTASPRRPATPRRDLLRDHVRGTQLGVDELLEVLIGDVEMVQGDWQDALEAARRSPDARFVTVGGDFVGPQGWRIGKSGSGATAVALAEANEQVECSRTDRDRTAEKVALARAELAASAQRRTAVVQRVGEAASALSAAADEQQRFVAQQRDVVTEIEALCTTQSELLARLENEQVRVEELERTKQVLENQETEHQVATERLTAALAVCDSGVAKASALRGDAEMRAAAIAERQENLHSRIAEIDTRLERDALERSNAVEKRAHLDRRANVYQKLATALDAQLAYIDAKLSEARQDHQQQSDAARLIVDQLNEIRNKRTHLADQVEKLRDRLANAAVERAELNTRLQALFERLRIEHNVTPDVATAVSRPPLAEGVDTQQRIEQLQQKLEIMGPINPLALEECEALQQRHEFLQTQLSDITATRRDLTKVIGSIDDDIMKTFSSAFADVASNFQKLFETLFPGGHGSIRLSNPDDLLNTGIEVSARPSGKNVRKLSLLSGGERTLTALAFLFAVFRSRPSPFYVLDEVEVALDDVNLHRFLNLIEEFRADAQLVLVSHQKRTMESADCLYGVSMQPGGSSTVVSEKVGSAVSEVA